MPETVDVGRQTRRANVLLGVLAGEPPGDVAGAARRAFPKRPSPPASDLGREFLLQITPTGAGAFRESMQHEPDEEVSWCDDVARA